MRIPPTHPYWTGNDVAGEVRRIEGGGMNGMLSVGTCS